MTCKDCIHYTSHRHFDPLLDEVYTNEDVEHLCPEFKDKSRFIELPCKVGDIVYGVISGGYDVKTPYIATAEVSSMEVGNSGLVIETYRSKEDNTRLSFGEIGKWVFLTREEAEKKLEEMMK